MKTIQEIKKDLIENIIQCLENYEYNKSSSYLKIFNDLTSEAIDELLIKACEEQKIICYNEAYIIDDPDYIGTYYPPQIISKDSIIDCPNVAEII